jgi:8-oxo-dGTP pyrophosphatase MutT (NUDIX family)
MTEIIQRVAAKAVIVNDKDQVLILREAATYGEGTQRGRYHMPGGRLEPGETLEVALSREVLEETGLEIDIGFPVYAGEWRPILKGIQNQIIGIFIQCKPKSDIVVLSSEHDEFYWVGSDNYRDFDIMDPEDKVLETFWNLR